MRDEGELHELLDRLDMESFLDHAGIVYKHTTGRSGRQLNVKTCPSCGGAKWKVYINEDTGLGNCFHGSCEMRTFNKWRFIKATLGEASNFDVYTYIRSVSVELGWRPKRRAAATNMEIGECVLPSSFELPDVNGDVITYLLDRGVDAELCRYFQLRYCHVGGYVYNDSGKQKCQDHSHRVIIPIFDLNGNLVTFQGRDITGNAEAKYIFPPGRPATGRYLYNGHNAWHVKHLVIGEGAFDAIALKKAFDEESEFRELVPIGTFGMHLSSSADGDASQLTALIELKRHGLERVTFMWDGEKNAIKNALDAANLVRRAGIRTRVAILPADCDPNEVSGEVVRTVFEQAYDPSTSLGLSRILAHAM